ncbi:hypothetical protein FQZ97_828070 [compost metagenome]
MRGKPHGCAVGNALRIHRDGAARRQRHALCAARAKPGVKFRQRLLAEEHRAGVAPQHLVQALRVLRRPGLDGCPGGFADRALIEQPAANALVGMPVVLRICHANLANAAIRLSDIQSTGALNLENQGVNGVCHPGHNTALQRGLRGGQGVDLLAAVPGLPAAQPRGWRIERRAVGGGGHAAGRHDRFVVAGEQSVGQAAVGLGHPVRHEAAHHPGLLLGCGGDGELAQFRARAGLTLGGAFAAADPGVPGFVQAVLSPARQLAPARWRPAALAALDRGGQGSRIARHVGHRGAGRRDGRRASHRPNRAGQQASYNGHARPHLHDRPRNLTESIHDLVVA